MKLLQIITIAILFTGLVGCDEDEQAAQAPAPTAPTQQAEEPKEENKEVVYQQIERLGRPAINEGLIRTNAFLNAFNSIPPSADLSEAAAPVLAEAAQTLDAVDLLDGIDNVDVGDVVAAFLPDVMRIDTRMYFAPGTTAYNGCASPNKGILCGGRKIKDDVMDITLSFLVNGDASGQAVKDNVSYEGVAGNPAQPGHKPVLAGFPYLAGPH